MEDGSKDVTPIVDLDETDNIHLAAIDSALKQAEAKGDIDLIANLQTMRKLVEDYPRQTSVRSNNFLHLTSNLDITDQDLVLHMRTPHAFTYPSGEYGGETIHDTGKFGSGALPILSMRHGILLVDPNTTRGATNANILADVLNLDLPSALSSVDTIPSEGRKISTHPYRTQPSPDNTYDLLYTHINPKARVSPLQFLQMSLDPKKAY